MAANAQYAAGFDSPRLPAEAARGLAILTCMDSRIVPLRMVGLGIGDAKILRNAGARVSDDVLRTLVLAVHLLAVERVMVVPHTACRMTQSTEDELHRLIENSSGVNTRSLDFGVVTNQEATLRADVGRIRAWPYIPATVVVGGFIYGTDTGELRPVC